MSSAARLETDAIPASDIVGRTIRSFTVRWSYPVLERRGARAFLLFIILGLCAVRACLGLVDSRQYSHDVFMFLDGAWRMLNGQRPHIDFYSHLGFLSYLPTVIGLKLSHGTAWGMGYGHALVALLLVVWAYALGRRRLADIPFALFCLGIAFLTTAPFALGEPLLQVSYAMTYNRFGYALLALLLLEAFSVARHPASEAVAGFSSGLIVGGLLFLKITYFVFALFLLLALIPCRAQTKKRWVGIGAGFLLAFLLCGIYFDFHLISMLRDLRIIAGGKHIKIRFYLLDEILIQVLGLTVFSACAALLLWSEQRRKSAFAVMLVSLTVVLTGAALILGNYESSGFPLGAFLVLLVLNEVLKPSSHQVIATDYFRMAVMLLGSVFIIGALFAGSLSTITALAGRLYTPRTVPALHSKMLSGFLPAGEDFWYGGYVNDGLALVRKFERSGDTIMCLDFSNPFSYGLAMKPAPGGTTVLQYKTTFDDRHLQSPHELFGQARLVIVPETFSDQTLQDTIARIYGPYLNSHFHLIGFTKTWRLYRQN